MSNEASKAISTISRFILQDETRPSCKSRSGIICEIFCWYLPSQFGKTYLNVGKFLFERLVDLLLQLKRFHVVDYRHLDFRNFIRVSKPSKFELNLLRDAYCVWGKLETGSVLAGGQLGQLWIVQVLGMIRKMEMRAAFWNGITIRLNSRYNSANMTLKQALAHLS